MSLVLGVVSVAYAVNVNQSSIKGLSAAYGFLLGQEHTLKRIAKQYPDLTVSVDLARRRFATTFPDARSQLELQLREALGPENLENIAQKIRESFRTTLDRQPITPEFAGGFLQLMDARARGEIESPMLEYLLAVQYASNPAREFLDGFRQRFSTDGHAKSRGVHLSLQLPRSWAAREGERPHIVKVWKSENGTGSEMLLLDIRDAKGFNPDRSDIEEFLRSPDVRETVPPGGVYVASGAFTVEARPGYWIEMKVTGERAEADLYQRVVMYQMFFRGRGIGLLCQAGGAADNVAKIDDALRRIRPLCRQVVNSMVLHQAY